MQEKKLNSVAFVASNTLFTDVNNAIGGLVDHEVAFDIEQKSVFSTDFTGLVYFDYICISTKVFEVHQSYPVLLELVKKWAIDRIMAFNYYTKSLCNIKKDVNACQNGIWRCEVLPIIDAYMAELSIQGTNIHCRFRVKESNYSNLKEQFTHMMNNLLQCSQWNKKYRVLIPKGVNHG